MDSLRNNESPIARPAIRDLSFVIIINALSIFMLNVNMILMNNPLNISFASLNSSFSQ
jgi:hypothetical protein